MSEETTTSEETAMSQETGPLAGITDATLEAMLRRAMRNTLILGMVPALVLWLASGWRNGAMLVAGALVSAGSIWEWRRLARLVNARLDHRKTGISAPAVVVLFLVRLGIFAGVIYGSLRFLHGSAVALLCGLGLAVATLSWEGLCLLRN